MIGNLVFNVQNYIDLGSIYHLPVNITSSQLLYDIDTIVEYIDTIAEYIDTVKVCRKITNVRSPLCRLSFK
jgi:hypothetical protein